MWDVVKQQQLDDLQRRQQEQGLTDEERQHVEHLLCEIEQEEWVTLRPTLERLYEEQKQLQEEYSRLRSQNAVLATLAERQEDLLRRARVQFAGLLSEHETLKATYERVTGQPLISSRS